MPQAARLSRGRAGDLWPAGLRSWHPFRITGSRLLNLNPLMRTVRAYLCRFVPSPFDTCNSGYNRSHGTFFAKGLAGRFCLFVVHLVLDESCFSGCRGGQGALLGAGAAHLLLDCTPYRRRISAVRGAVDASHFRDRSPLSDHQTDSIWSDSWVCSCHRALHHRLRDPPLDFSAALEYSCSEV